MWRALPALAATVLVFGTGVIPGMWQGRWAPSRQLEEATARLRVIPLTVGGWEGKDLTLEPEVWSATNAAGYVYRTYVNRGSGAEVILFIECGRPGPVAVHTPDVCYKGNGYEVVGGRGKYAVAAAAPGQPHELWVAKLQKEDPAGPRRLRIFWAWSVEGAWQAPDNPRLTFARHPALYKLYVVHKLARPDEPLEGDPAGEFLKLLMPELQKYLRRPQ
jgi:hypothetical protein